MDHIARSLSLALLVCVFCVCRFFGQTHVTPLNSDDEIADEGLVEEQQWQQQWQEAIVTEHKALEAFGTWAVEKPPPGASIVGLTWVFKCKLDVNGTIS